MLIANAHLENGRLLLLLGLSAENRTRLDAGHPIQLSRKTHVAIPDNLELFIFTGDTEESMKHDLEALACAPFITDDDLTPPKPQ